MDEAQQEYVEEIGVFFERFGLARMVGRVLGALLIRSRDHSAEELANLLQASRGSISQATRVLVEWGLVRRSSKPGERRDYFSVRTGAWEEVMRREIDWIAEFRDLAARGLNVAEPDESGRQESLEEMRDFFTYLEREYPAIMDRWREERGKERTWKG
ncbi:MarR family transcriptional regulator [soil metagenome]